MRRVCVSTNGKDHEETLEILRLAATLKHRFLRRRRTVFGISGPRTEMRIEKNRLCKMAFLVRRRSRRLTEEKLVLRGENNRISLRRGYEKAERLRGGELDRGPRILILANAWDVISERIGGRAGFPAFGLSSND